MALRNQDYVRQLAANPAPAKAADDESGFSFGDFLDIINPLQHIPVVSTIYRKLTGDEIGIPAKIAGDTLYGGLTGLACSVGDTIFAHITGKNIGDTVYAALIGDDDTPATAVAEYYADTPAGDAITPWTPPPVAPQQAIAAYRASGRLLAAY